MKDGKFLQQVYCDTMRETEREREREQDSVCVFEIGGMCTAFGKKFYNFSDDQPGVSTIKLFTVEIMTS
jgi:hypothetical protein